MKQLLALIKRNCKLFFKDKGMFLTSLISPAVLLVLYITFLANVYKNTLLDFVPKDTSNLIINGIVYDIAIIQYTALNNIKRENIIIL